MRFSPVAGLNLPGLLSARLKIDSFCVICGRQGVPERDLCDGCESNLIPRIHTNISGFCSHLCLACGEEIPVPQSVSLKSAEGSVKKSVDTHSTGYCGACYASSSPFVRVVAPYRYMFPVDHVIRRLKYHDQRQLGRVLGSLLAAAVSRVEELPDFLLPMPLFAGREAERGFNQAADIARWCAAELGIAHKPFAATRLIDTGSLAGLSRAERQHRILGAFQASEEVYNRRVAIVDDVLTTGSTARELARELYDTGALSVELWVLARTSRER